MLQLPQDYLDQFAETPGYLDFARFGPPSRAVLGTSTRLLEQACTAEGSTVDELMRAEAPARACAARLCGFGTEQVVLLPNTSLGLFQAAFAVRGQVLVSTGEFPANAYPWARAAQADGIDVRWLRPPSGVVTVEAVRDALEDETTVVAISAVDFRTGHLADLAAIREVIGDRLLVVDAVQGFGAVEAPWHLADVLVAGGQKWLRAGWGTGFAALSERALDQLRPLLSGWTGAREPGVFDGTIHPPAPDATSWSVTRISPISAGALATALGLVEQAGVPAIQAHVAERVGELEDTLRSLGAQLVSATASRGGILAFTVPGQPAERVGAALAAADITATVRAEHVRLSPHASTPASVVGAVRDALSHL